MKNIAKPWQNVVLFIAATLLLVVGIISSNLQVMFIIWAATKVYQALV